MLLIKYIISIEYWNYIFCRLCRLPLRKGGGGETYPGVGVYGPCEENDQDESHHLCGAELPYPHRLRTICLQNRTTGDQRQVWPKIHKSTNYIDTCTSIRSQSSHLAHILRLSIKSYVRLCRCMFTGRCRW